MFKLFDISRLLEVPVGAAYHVVAALAAWFAPLPGGLATAAAIIAFTVAVRLLLLPLSYYAIRGEGARARLLPQVAQLQRRYARQPDRLQRELAKLRQAEGSGLFAGCLPLLLQIPFFSVMYRLFLSRSVAGAPNTLLTHRLFGASLGSHWLASPFGQQGMVFLGLLALLGVVAWFGARMARRAAASRTAASQGGAVGLLTRLMPYATLPVAAVVPLAAGVYMLTTTAWTVLERAVLRHKLVPS
jgi:YidC/Oxa1 family membrane protein insertase